jgi:polyketide synthase 2
VRWTAARGTERVETCTTTRVAIVGMGCRFPGSIDTPETFWNSLCTGACGITELPTGRWSSGKYFDPFPRNSRRKTFSRIGVIERYDLFDAGFFKISPREAAAMDPQQRLLLTVTWEALEDAGLAADRLEGTAVGVFVGAATSDYRALSQNLYDRYEPHLATGTALSIAANRISNRFDFRGPSVVFDTACSSSLVALDAAWRALAASELDIAVVAGVNAVLAPYTSLVFSTAGMLSPQGELRAFDESADGYVRGEGAAAVVLQRWTAESSAGVRHAYALIRSSAVNQDGRTLAITAPSGDMQEALFRQVCHQGGVDPAQIDYVEAHGTGTPVGDPIELRAIGRALGRAPGRERDLLVGSVKANIGHLEAGAGVAGLIKTALCIRHRAIPPQINVTRPNPRVRLERLRLRIPAELTRLESHAVRALVNSFGFGGTNACTLLEAVPPEVAATAKQERLEIPAKTAGLLGERQPIPLSAATPSALALHARRLAERLRSEPELSLGRVVTTLAHHRAHLDYRALILAEDREALLAQLDSIGSGGCEGGSPVASGSGGFRESPVLVFSGQGGQYPRMAVGLLAQCEGFRRELKRVDHAFARVAGLRVIPELTKDASQSELDKTRLMQPAIFAIQVALANLWRGLGVTPAAVIGHSFGEVSAAHVAGAIPLEDACRIVALRGALQQERHGMGAMAAVGLPSATVLQLLASTNPAEVGLAAINAPELVTVSGTPEGVDRFLDETETAYPGCFQRRLPLAYAFHSAQMDGVRESLVEGIRGVAFSEPEVPWFSTVTGDLLEPSRLDPGYWGRNIREPVLFGPALAAAIDQGHRLYLEIGARPVLCGLVRACLSERRVVGECIASLDKDADDLEGLKRSLGRLYVAGANLDWRRLAPTGSAPVRLPFTPMEPKPHWIDAYDATRGLLQGPDQAFLGQRQDTPVPTWRSLVSLDHFPFLQDHRIGGDLLFPATGYLELMLLAARVILGGKGRDIELSDVAIHAPLSLSGDGAEIIETVYQPVRGQVSVHRRRRDTQGPWILCADAKVLAYPIDDSRMHLPEPAEDLPCTADGETFYQAVGERGYVYGAGFKGIQSLAWSEREARSVILHPTVDDCGGGWLLHPALLDSAAQTSLALGGADLRTGRPFALPVAIERLRCKGPLPLDAGVDVRVRADLMGPSGSSCSLTVRDGSGRPLVRIDGLKSRTVARQPDRHQEGAPREVAAVETWVEAPLETAPFSRTRSALVIDDTESGGQLAALFATRGLRSSCCRMEQLGSLPPFTDGVLLLPMSGSAQGAQLDSRICRQLERAQARGTQAVLDLIKVFADRQESPRLWVCMAGGRVLPGDQPARWRPERSIVHATVAGMLRTALAEYPRLRCTSIDLDPADPASAVQTVATEVLADSDETEIAWRQGQRFVSRLALAQPDSLSVKREPVEQVENYRLRPLKPGAAGSLDLQRLPLPDLEAEEVLVEMQAFGINFRDVMAVSGLLPAEAETGSAIDALGLEGAGIVAKTGPEAPDLAVGMPVMVSARGAMCKYVKSHRRATLPIPPQVAIHEAAGLPTAFLTAHYALVEVGRLSPGETCLIHAATGGVGLAALQVARARGARVIATAGTPQKRVYLTQLGIDAVADSRSLGFRDQVLEATGGDGVDLVLNAQAGDFIAVGLSLLRPFGRFLEIGKRDVYEDRSIGLRALAANKSFSVIDLATIGRDRPVLFGRLCAHLLESVRDGVYTPLPTRAFPMREAADAFRFLGQAGHIGKVVLRRPEPGDTVAEDLDMPMRFRPDGTYLVTGGTSGFGMAVAVWLAEHGAGQLALFSRRGAVTAEAAAALTRMKAAGARVSVHAIDVSEQEAVEAAVHALASQVPPIRGVFHAAMVLDDGVMEDLTAERVQRVLRPKVLGAWAMHAATLGSPVDHFVLFSSLAATLGARGQASYVAANLFQDEFARYRHQLGLPALSVNWGAIGDTGVVSRVSQISDALERSGVYQMPLERCLERLGRLLRCDISNLAVANIDVEATARLGANPHTTKVPRVADFVKGGERGGVGLIAEIRAAGPQARAEKVNAFVALTLAEILRCEPSEVQLDRRLTDLGVDSLGFVDLRIRLEGVTGTPLSIEQITAQATPRGLAGVLLSALAREE